MRPMGNDVYVIKTTKAGHKGTKTKGTYNKANINM